MSQTIESVEVAIYKLRVALSHNCDYYTKRLLMEEYTDAQVILWAASSIETRSDLARNSYV